MNAMDSIRRIWCWLTSHSIGTRNWRAVCWKCNKDFGDLKKYFDL